MAGIKSPLMETDWKAALPDYESTLQANAYRVLRDEGIPEDRLEAEWNRLRHVPAASFEVATVDDLEAMTREAGSQPNAVGE